MIRPIAHLVILAFTAAVPVAALGQPAESTVDRLNILRTNSDAIEELVSRVMPSVVQVVVTRYAPDDTVGDPVKNGLVRRGRSIGSGVVGKVMAGDTERTCQGDLDSKQLGSGHEPCELTDSMTRRRKVQ